MSDNPIEKAPPTTTSSAELFNELGIVGFLQPGLTRAISKLLCGITDIPVAWLESFADSIRSTSEARRHLRIEAGKALAQKFETDSLLAARAYAQNASKIIREQVTIEEVTGLAVEQLAEVKTDTDPKGEPDDDWLAAFRSEASQRTAPEIKYAFARILSGEIRSPGTFSLRTLHALGAMDTELASLFRTLCNVTLIISGYDGRALSLGGNAGDNALQEFGLAFDKLTMLQDSGLIKADLHSWRNYSPFVKLGFHMRYGGRQARVSAMEGMGKMVKLHGVSLTNIGEELYGVVDFEENNLYTVRLKEFLERNHIAFKLH